MLPLLSVLISLGLWLGRPVPVLAGPRESVCVPAPDNPFFSRDELVELTLVLPRARVLNDRGATPGLHPARLSYRDAAAAQHTLAVQVQVRGNRRKDPAVCDFPPLWVKFPPESRPGSLFGPVEELKLTTHCLSDKYTLREYLVYKLYNVLTDLSYRVRLCRITYHDSGGRGAAEAHYAFFLEPTEALAQRHQATVVPRRLVIGMENLNPTATATMVVFQYLIGNTDWSVPYRHNIRLLSQNLQAPPLPVAFDFDYSGLVMAPYAVPPEQLGITSVRQRLYRGFTFPPATYAAVRHHFNARREALNYVYRACPYLSRQEQDFAIRYLNDFYDVLNDPKAFERQIVRAGHRNEEKRIHIRGFD
ncbi:hypothetical protein I2I05_11580 [Hymenobacter sp. BT683]|uniref:Uncharacterized protein n=1 Tax=Hymenobacter jeongseonensis TaxID=2791027 RepID=A0ABS0II39_9BACT|nr:hypothetical protein [Hymenobacter jeongseonensis]MBF9238035.1 hypothetical protein [Hymenobacter jeongseonensis]